jgi:type I restriction enzyme S subunit
VVDFRTIRIADFGRVITGKTPPSSQPELFGDIHPFLTPTDIDGYARHIEPDRFLSSAGRDYQHRLMLPPRAVCVVCIGATIGKVCMTDRPSFTNQQINSVAVNEDEHDPFFVYHLLTTLRDELKSNAGGAATPIINKTAFSEIKVSVPPLATQQGIARILSAYDELIEISQRRIKILEAMARGLYREWFVYFRFPGHENHPRVASALGEIPQGWEVKTIQDFGKVVTGKTPSKANAGFFGVDVPFVKTPDMHGNLFVLGTNESLSTAGANSQSNKTLPVGSICVSCIGTIGVVSITTEESQTNQQINSVVLAKNECREFLFLRLQEAKQTLENLGSNGATMGNVNKSKFETMEIVAPPDAHLFDFHRLTQPMFNSILNLTRQIQNLRQTRDLLLPRLLSGQINVEPALP